MTLGLDKGLLHSGASSKQDVDVRCQIDRHSGSIFLPEQTSLFRLPKSPDPKDTGSTPGADVFR